MDDLSLSLVVDVYVLSISRLLPPLLLSYDLLILVVFWLVGMKASFGSALFFGRWVGGWLSID